MAFPSQDKISDYKETSAHIVSLLTSPASSSKSDRVVLYEIRLGLFFCSFSFDMSGYPIWSYCPAITADDGALSSLYILFFARRVAVTPFAEKYIII